MAFDATVGGASANSYLTVAEALAYAQDDLGPAAAHWAESTVTVEEHQRALMRATREVDAYLQNSGLVRYSSTQTLLYPRPQDVSSSTPFIPTPIKRATFAQAKFLLNGGAEHLDRADIRSSRRLASVSETDYSYAQEDAEPPFLTAEARGHLQGVYGRSATIRSVKLSTDYSDPYGTEVLA